MLYSAICLMKHVQSDVMWDIADTWCVDYCYYCSCGILLLAQARPKMPCIYTSIPVLHVQYTLQSLFSMHTSSPKRLQSVDGVEVHALYKGEPVHQSVQLWGLPKLFHQALTGLLELTPEHTKEQYSQVWLKYCCTTQLQQGIHITALI